MPDSRLPALDYLRGVAAVSIMVYHLCTWWIAPFSPESPLGRVGVYGVGVFYVLSGLTLQHVYEARLLRRGGLRSFFVRRAFRIFPLLWLVTFASIVINRLQPDFGSLLLNVTGLFGFVQWDTYYSAGVWSIGNELVFYSIFPLIVLAAAGGPPRLTLVGIALALPFIYVATTGLESTTPLEQQWSVYINPLNQALLFFAGFAVGHFSRGRRIQRRIAWILLISCAAAFLLLPIPAEPSTLVTGWPRFAFTILCVGLCTAAYHLPKPAPRPIHVPLSMLGEMSYSVYLLHPIVFALAMRTVGRSLPVSLTLPCAILMTIGLSWVVYRVLEKPMMQIGRKLTKSAAGRQLASSPGQ